MIEIEVYLLVDDIGDSATGPTAEAARERYEETIQPLANAGGFRIVTLKVSVPLPEAVEIAIEVPGLGPALATA